MLNKQDYAKQCFDYTVEELKKINYTKQTVFRPFKETETKTLVSYFENNECFLNLNENVQTEIIKEVHYRICDKFDAPYFNVSFDKFDKLNKNCVNCGLTDYKQNLVINLFSQTALKALPKNKREAIGLNYLDTVIHETRHAIQYNYMIKMLKGDKNVPLFFKFIGADTILSNLIDNAKIKNFSEHSTDQFYLSGAEIDARIFANNAILYLANAGMFEDSKRAEDFANGGNFVACALENYGNSMALSYVTRLKKIIKNVQEYIKIEDYEEFMFLNDNNALKQYEKELIEREAKNANLLLSFYKDRLQELKDNQYIKEFQPKIIENLNNQNLSAVQSLIEQANALTYFGFEDLSDFLVVNLMSVINLNNKQLFADKIKSLAKTHFQQHKEQKEDLRFRQNLANANTPKLDQ